MIKKKSYSNNPGKDFLNSKPHELKTVFTKYHQADGNNTLVLSNIFRKIIKIIKSLFLITEYKKAIFIQLKKLLVFDNQKSKKLSKLTMLKLNLTPKQSLEENPTVDITEGKEIFTSRFDQPEHVKEVVLKCGKHVKIIV